MSLDDVKTKNLSAHETDEDSPGRPDGVIRLTTTPETDMQIHDMLKSYKNKPGQRKYNGACNNCSDYAGAGVDAATVGELNAKEQILPLVKSTTPNKLYKETSKASNATIEKDAGDKVDKPFKESVKGGQEEE